MVLKRKRSLIILLVVSIMVLSFASVGLAYGSTAVQTNTQLNEARELFVQEKVQQNQQQQLRLQQCDGDCSEDCEPEQKRLQKNLHRQENKQILQGGRNQGNGNGQNRR